MGLCVTWRGVAASVVGTSHTTTGTGCEDSCLINVEEAENESPFLIIFVTDGAGSALHGGEGAELAIEAASEFVAQQLSNGTEFALNDPLAVECVQAVRARIFERAEQNGGKARDYACTFLGVIASASTTLLMQIGDGGIVVDFGNGLEVPITPQSGEYANMTNFITDENAIDVLKVAVFSDLLQRVAAFTDGIQRLALNLANNTAHSPFFTPFFTVLAKASADQEEGLQNELVKFLGSAAVNERTDDDKTLALAHWVG